MDNNNQAAFMGALNSLKEYAKVNGNIVTKQDVESYFKDLGLDDSKYQMITGYLLANDITVKGENGVDNEFLNMLEKSAVKQTEELEEEGKITINPEYGYEFSHTLETQIRGQLKNGLAMIDFYESCDKRHRLSRYGNDYIATLCIKL